MDIDRVLTSQRITSFQDIRAGAESLIQVALERRSVDFDVLQSNPESGKPMYVHRLCERLVDYCHERGAKTVSLKDILRADMLASGHCDYLRKFGLYVAELWRDGVIAGG